MESGIDIRWDRTAEQWEAWAGATFLTATNNRGDMPSREELEGIARKLKTREA